MEDIAEFEYSLKLLLLGDSCVGKSNFIFRFINNEFNGHHLSSSGIELKSTELIIDNKKLHLQLWDTAGQEKFKSVTKSLFMQVQGFIAMFDLTKEESFINIKSWIKSIKEECGSHIPILLVGNKNDLKDLRIISDEEIKEFTDKENLKYIETSSKTGDNVKKAINIICKQISELEIYDNDIRESSFSLDSIKLINKKKKICC